MQQFFTVDSAQFEQFCKRAQHWQQRLGLGDWVCTAMVHADSTLDDASLAGANAMISLLVDGHSFRLTCNTQWSIPVNEPNLNYNRAGLHEMMTLRVRTDVCGELAYKACSSPGAQRTTLEARTRGDCAADQCVRTGTHPGRATGDHYAQTGSGRHRQR